MQGMGYDIIMGSVIKLQVSRFFGEEEQIKSLPSPLEQLSNACWS